MFTYSIKIFFNVGLWLLLSCLLLAGCGSFYSGLVSSSGLGAEEYRPAVVVSSGNEARYEEVLTVCRQAARNRQATAAQKAQLETLTGVTESAVGAALIGAFIGKDSRQHTTGEGALVGAAVGVVSELASAFAAGSNKTADESRRILLNCLKVTSQDGALWQVVE